ncbi:putative spindle pole body-associated protein sad1 [Rosellinia necatrix]|uniref:Putative spindle pole body-associated protein sad1 n=1 Tax=Rosellinia necatrix TaxID=77044 RepID=A0A1W2TAW6_ROSNE|nr:putative spindle pole body-associated protein sad1 [Rosellinia necatrix]
MPPRTRKKGLDPSPDLPGLFPTHDGSYGINTLINIDGETRKGIAKEPADDKKWMKSMGGKVVKKHDMNSNLKKAIDKSHKEVEEEEHQIRTPTSRKVSHPSVSTSGLDESSESPNTSALASKAVPHVPNYNPNNLPFVEEYDDRPRPPYKRAELPSVRPYAHTGVNQFISPPTEDIPFYGMPQGQGSNEPIASTHPDSSTNFTYENGLFAKAILQTPGPTTNPSSAPQFTAEKFDLPTRKQTARQPSYSPDVSTSEQEESTSSMSSSSEGRSATSSEGKPALGKPTLSQQPMPRRQSALPLSPPTSDEPLKPPEAQNTSTWKPPRAAVIKRSPSNQSQLSGIPASQPGKTKPKVGVSAGRRQAWVWPSLDLIVRSIALFSMLALVLWFTFSTIPGVLNDNEKGIGLPQVNLRLPNFDIRVAWKAISDLLPEIPDIHPIPHHYPHNIPNSPQHSHSSDINPVDLSAELRKLMPDLVWVRKNKNGKLKIPEDFWHALKGLIDEDDSILSLKDSDISENHWRAIKSRMQSHADFESGVSTKEMEALVEKSISHSWSSWLGQNNHALKKALTGIALTKDDFIRLYQQEATSYQREIRQEFTELQERIKSITQQMFKLRDEALSTSSVTKEEMTRVINSLISKSINNMKLDAVAQGLIKGNANDVLANQVNLFGIGAGVSVNPSFSSKPWVPPKNHINSKNFLDKDGYNPQPRMAVFSPWSQEGECFCAAANLKGYGKNTNSIAAITSRNIVPQHFVVEHILPGATLDPGAMPKEIEVWIEIEEVTLRNEVQAFSEIQFPNTPKEETLHDGFVKIGHFTYENKNSGDGVQVFKISDELTRMRAVTNHILVRAINNYGADHTCFYRLRLYGEIIERPDDPPAYGNLGGFWS